MAFTVNRIGLTIVYDPPEDAHDFDVVIVHGLFGHPEKTWAAKTGVFWPRDLLPGELPSSRIMTWGYDVQHNQLFNATSSLTIFQHSETLLEDLSGIRIGRKRKRLIFIAHSLGGIVVKDALHISANDLSQEHIADIAVDTLGVMFLGTPHHGSKVATLGKIAAQISSIFLPSNTKVLRGLEVNSEILDRISRGFGQLLVKGSVKVHSFREEEDTHGVLVVNSFSSSTGYLYETRGSLPANHRDMAKFTSAKDIKFLRVAAVLKRWTWMCEPRNPSHWQYDEQAIPDGLIFDEHYENCLQSLSSFEARRRVTDVEHAYQETLGWLFGPEIHFRDWLRGAISDPIFWIQGKPASGKSTAMKFALCHENTMKLLKEYIAEDWTLAGYFFHDRGSSIQKSVRGFLGELLFRILEKQRHLFPFVLPIYSNCSGLEDAAGRDIWNVSELEAALVSIGSNTMVDINLCVFVDALDEHDGNHRSLLNTLFKLASLAKNPHFRLRLCVAGRPENVLKDALQSCPGFAIQDHTMADIEQYARARISNDLSNELSEDGKHALEGLVSVVIAGAEGVFLWVRLVVDEIIEGLCEGDTLEELRELISSIPNELGQLYSRAIRRKRRTSGQATTNHRHEAFVMFQMAICADRPFQLLYFIAASMYLTTGDRAIQDLEDLSPDQMVRRLNSRSSGLLEVSRADDGFLALVQFMHQTVKEYMQTGEGLAVIQDGLPQDLRLSGPVLISRFLKGAKSTQLADGRRPLDPGRSLELFLGGRYQLPQPGSIQERAMPFDLSHATHESVSGVMTTVGNIQERAIPFDLFHATHKSVSDVITTVGNLIWDLGMGSLKNATKSLIKGLMEAKGIRNQ